MKIVVGKLVVLGHQDVGKTSMCLRYIEKIFSSHISPTVGASFFCCKIPIEDMVVKLQIWDTAGQERFKAMAPMFYRNANAALLVFDITRPKTFESMKSWVLELKKNIDEALVLCVIGNKVDLVESRKVSRDEATQYAKSIGASYYECSAREDQGIEQIFLNVAAGLIRLSDNDMVRSLKIYESVIDVPLGAQSNELVATELGRIEIPHKNKPYLVYGTPVAHNCC